MQQFIGTSLKTRLYLLVLAAFVPVAALIFYIAEEQKTLEIQAFLQKALVLARTAAYEESQQLESTRNLLAVIADAYLISESHGDEVTGPWANLITHLKGYADVGILDPDGRLVAGTDSPQIGRDYSNTIWYQDSRKNKKWTIGPYYGAQNDGQPVLYFARPVLNHRGQIDAVAFAALDLNWMNRTIVEHLTGLPEGSRLTLLNEDNGLIRYDTTRQQWSVPTKMNQTLLRQIGTKRSGTLSAMDENKLSRIYAFAPLSSSLGGPLVTVLLEIPEAAALAATKRIFTRNVALLVLSALIAVLAVWWVGDVFILRRLRAMVAATRKLAAGDLEARIGKIGVRDELSHLAGVFDEMAASLQLRMEREKHAMTSLEHSREQLRKLSAYQQEVREQERIRIAREIHDQFGQSLTILKMDLAWLKKQWSAQSSEVDEKMVAMAHVIDEALKNLHAVTAELRPVILDDFGLAAAIEWQVEEFRIRSGVNCRMENSGFEPDLPKDQATALFRIFQESLTNIIRHARANNVEVRLEKDNGEVRLQVRDNGRGITEAEINDPTAYGLLGMRERLYPWNGSVSFEGRPGGGTCVTIRLPMAEKREGESP